MFDLVVGYIGTLLMKLYYKVPSVNPWQHQMIAINKTIYKGKT
jgi:hypothetical protein